MRSLDLTALARSSERPGFVLAAARLDGRAGALHGRACPASPAPCATGPATALGAATPTRWRRCTRPTGSDSKPAASWIASCSSGARSTPCDATPGPGAPPPVFVYGFDDFTPLELDALETLARVVGADVTVSLPYERGRAAFKAVATVFEQLSALASEAPLELPAVDDHYAPRSRDALHHLERSPLRRLGAPAQARRSRAAAGGRRAARRGGAGRGRGARAAARRHRAGRRGRGLSRPQRVLVGGRAGVRRLRHPLLAGAPAAAAPHRARPRRCWRCCAAPRSRGATPICWPICALPASSTTRRSRTASRPTCARTAPRPPRAPGSCGRCGAGRSRRSTSWRAAAAEGPDG